MNAETAIDDATETYGIDTMNAPAKQEIIEMRPGQQAVMIQPPASPITPMQMIQQAAASGDMDVVAKLMDLQDRWEKNNARKAFDAAIAAAKAEIKPIIKNRVVDFTSQKGRTNYRYEDFAGVAAQVDPILAKNGINYRFRTQGDKDHLTVICILSHRDGHSEENPLTAPNDTSGNKNAIQAIGSTQTYLQRYTLKAALGLAASNDDDAQAATNGGAEPVASGKVTAEQVAEIKAALDFKGMAPAKFLNWVRISCRNVQTIEDVPAAYFASCIDGIKKSGGSK